MSNPVDIKSFKDRKKYKQIVEDLTAVIKVFDLTQRSLVHFKKYKNVQEVISILETNLTLLDLYKKKYEAELKRKE